VGVGGRTTAVATEAMDANATTKPRIFRNFFVINQIKFDRLSLSHLAAEAVPMEFFKEFFAGLLK
jgi:hypothetical protein